MAPQREREMEKRRGGGPGWGPYHCSEPPWAGMGVRTLLPSPRSGCCLVRKVHLGVHTDAPPYLHRPHRDLHFTPLAQLCTPEILTPPDSPLS